MLTEAGVGTVTNLMEAPRTPSVPGSPVSVSSHRPVCLEGFSPGLMTQGDSRALEKGAPGMVLLLPFPLSMKSSSVKPGSMNSLFSTKKGEWNLDAERPSDVLGVSASLKGAEGQKGMA